MYDKYTIANAPAGYYLVYKAGVQPFVLRVERPRVESVMQYVRNYTYPGVQVWFCPQHEKLRS